MNKHNPYDLAQMQMLPLGAKIRMTQQRIRAWYEYWDGNVYVSISGGKDSQVLAHIVKEIYPDVPLVFVNTGLEWDSVRKKAESMADKILYPEMSFVDVIKNYGYPVISKEIAKRVSEYRNAEKKGKLEKSSAYKEFNGLLMGTKEYANQKSLHNKEKHKYLIDAPFRISHKCCLVNKEGVAQKYEKATNRKAYIGTMASESRARTKAWIQNGCNSFDSQRPHSNPLSFWTEEDILLYIINNEMEIAEIYGQVGYMDKDGFIYQNNQFNEDMPLTTTNLDRTGCVFCMFGIAYNTDKFLKLKAEEPQKYNFVMRGGKFDDFGMWIPSEDEKGKMGLGYKFVIDWLNEHGDLNIKY